MKTKNLYFILLLWGICILASCEKEEVWLIQPSIDLVNMEGEGGEATITFRNGNWIIDRIENRSANNEYISGNIYVHNGMVENGQLQLSGLGILVSGWESHGFTITREREDELFIFINENWAGDDFIFAIILQSGTEEKEIIVNQKKSQGYTFSKIEYSLQEGDGDTFHIEQTRSSYPSLTEPTRMPVMPYTGLCDLSWFESLDTAGYYWLSGNESSVQVPVDIDSETGQVLCSSYKNLFSLDPIEKETQYSNVVTGIEMPAGFPIVTVNVTFRKRQVTFHATLINNRTGSEKVFSGKWIEKAPTSKYEVSVKSY